MHEHQNIVKTADEKLKVARRRLSKNMQAKSACNEKKMAKGMYM